MMRVALVGNMNNGNFAAMRHLRDQGLDAHLLMYSDETAHFLPQHDTWDWDRWSPYVRTLPFTNGGIDAVLARASQLRPHFEGFDVCLANGFAPAWFARMHRRIDLFMPYAEGIEFIIHHAWRWRRPLSTAFSYMRKRLMESALVHNVKAIGAANLHAHSMDTFRRLGLQPTLLPILALYPEPLPERPEWPAGVEPLIARMRSSPLVVFSHVSHIWQTLPYPHFMGGIGKRNQWLIEGFAGYVQRSGDRQAVLCLFDYGSDVQNSRTLIERLGIASQVLWFPLMSRRFIMGLLQFADIGGSEFAGMLWGGCGWEFLASGVPMLHQLSDAGAYERDGTPLPPFFNVHSASNIAQVLLTNDRAALRCTGQQARAWFDTHHGRALARRYVELLTQLRER
ncbi:MAG: hypothetical protein Q8N44_02840 [Rubrivivax sp.]|nr:hypothetical protein [Rubrivivax sp.]